MIKYFFTDLDGTLLDDKGRLPKDFPKLLRDLKKAGRELVVASGRQHPALLRLFKNYAKDMYFLAANGSLVAQGAKVLSYSPMPKAGLLAIVARLDSLPYVKCVLSGTKEQYVRPEWKGKEKIFRYYEVSPKTVADFEAVDEDLTMLSIYDGMGDAAGRILPCLTFAERNFTVTCSNQTWVDVAAKGVSKGAAIRSFLELMKSDKREAVAFGDYLNDLSMVGSVGRFYAVDNAHHDVKAVATKVIGSNTAGGVVDAIYQLIEEDTDAKAE